MTVVRATPATIRRAAEIVRRGGLVAFPTETVYGLGADARSEAAVARIFEAKRRPLADPLIVHVADPGALDAVCTGFDDRAHRLAESLWPGPLTLVLPKRASVPDIVTAGHPTVAVRVPAHPVALTLLREAACPIAAPSANPFGFLSPTLAEHVEEQLGAEVDLILDGGPCVVGVESTIVGLTGPRPLLLRIGGTEIHRIEALIGKLEVPEPTEAPRAPGQLESHYAPRARVVLLQGRAPLPPRDERCGHLRLKEEGSSPPGFVAVEILSRAGDLREAASNLFASLHRLDRAGLDAIFVEPIPEEGLGATIADRLRRTAARR